MSPEVVGIIQARMGSTRLPGKSAMNLGNWPLIVWVVTRCLRSRFVSRWYLATTQSPLDDVLIDLVAGMNVTIYRGDETDVASRFVSILKRDPANLFVRVCADNPFIEPEFIDCAVEFSLDHPEIDMAFNHAPIWYDNVPDGLGCEVCQSSSFLGIKFDDLPPIYSEHVTKALLESPNLRVCAAPMPSKYNWISDIKLDIDTTNDFEMIDGFVSATDISLESSGLEIIEKLKKFQMN